MNRRPFSELLTETMRARGDDVAHLVDRFGVAQPTISRWCSGDVIPSDQRAPALAAYLELPIEQVLNALYEGRMRRKMRSAASPEVQDLADRVAVLEETMHEIKQLLSERL